jgi:peptidoglycan/LPS O-acetylase OafA/YrhL
MRSLSALTSLRFFAAVLVILTHGAIFTGASLPRARISLYNILSQGGIGIDFFFVLFPFLLPVLTRQTSRQLLATAVVAWAALLVLPVGVVGVAHILAHLQHRPVNGAVVYFVLNRNPAVRFPEFIQGTITGIVYLRDWHAPWAVFRLPALGRVVCVIGFCLLAAMSIEWTTPVWAAATVLFVPLYAATIYVPATNVGPMTRPLAWPVLVLLGEASYGMYILHWPLWSVFRGLGVGLWGASSVTSPAFYAVYVVFVIGAALLSLFLLEKPARRAIRARFGSRPIPVRSSQTVTAAEIDRAVGTRAV